MRTILAITHDWYIYIWLKLPICIKPLLLWASSRITPLFGNAEPDVQILTS